MNDKRNQIITALKIIKSECDTHGNCNGTCPFYVEDECKVQEPPHLWEINDSEKWKALG